MGITKLLTSDPYKYIYLELRVHDVCRKVLLQCFLRKLSRHAGKINTPLHDLMLDTVQVALHGLKPRKTKNPPQKQTEKETPTCIRKSNKRIQVRLYRYKERE